MSPSGHGITVAVPAPNYYRLAHTSAIEARHNFAGSPIRPATCVPDFQGQVQKSKQRKRSWGMFRYTLPADQTQHDNRREDTVKAGLSSCLIAEEPCNTVADTMAGSYQIDHHQNGQSFMCRSQASADCSAHLHLLLSSFPWSLKRCRFYLRVWLWDTLQGSDLKRLLEMYRDWQKRLLPGMDLDDFIAAAEKLGNTNMMKVINGPAFSLQTMSIHVDCYFLAWQSSFLASLSLLFTLTNSLLRWHTLRWYALLQAFL